MKCRDCRFRGTKARKGYPCGKRGVFMPSLDAGCKDGEPIPSDDIKIDLGESLGQNRSSR